MSRKLMKRLLDAWDDPEGFNDMLKVMDEMREALNKPPAKLVAYVDPTDPWDATAFARPAFKRARHTVALHAVSSGESV